MPSLTISTDKQPRSESPTRPPMSPITPPLRPADRPSFTHSQPDQTGMAPPAPEAIDFDSNPDAIALKSAISVLQMQRRRAAADIQTLNRVKDQAVEDPDAFVQDLIAGKVNSEGGGDSTREWASLPKKQDVVRCPPINWSQYAVVGESLDKLHNEQVTHPTQGAPFVVGTGGAYEFKGDGKQERYDGVAAPYAPGKDKIDRKTKGKK